MSSFLSSLFGSPGKNKKVSALTGGQEELLAQLVQSLLEGSGPLGLSEDMFQESFVDPAMTLFNTQTAPSIQQKFIGAGAQSGSNLQDVLARAGADVQGQLNQKRAELLENQLNRQLQGTGLALGTQAFGFEQQAPKSGLLGEILSGIGTAAGGPLGSSIGTGLAGLFQNRSASGGGLGQSFGSSGPAAGSGNRIFRS